MLRVPENMGPCEVEVVILRAMRGDPMREFTADCQGMGVWSSRIARR